MMAVEGKRIRSPSYPALDLETAVDKVREAQSAYSTVAVDREALAKSIGYSSLSGAALQALAALTSYGLLEGRGKGEAGVTELAMQVLFAESKEEYAQAARRAALSPPVFAQITEKFENHLPHKDGVVSFLCRSGFTEKAAKIAARAYVNSMNYVASLGDSERNDRGAVAGQTASLSVTEESVSMASQGNAVGEFRDLVRGHTSDGSTFRLLVNSDFGEEQWEDAMAMLQVQFDIAKRKAARVATQVSEPAEET